MSSACRAEAGAGSIQGHLLAGTGRCWRCRPRRPGSRRPYSVGSVAAGTESQPGRNKRRSQRTLFDGIAERYEKFRPGYPAHVLEFVAATAGLGPGAAVLEVGCGTGQLTERLAGAGFRVTAIDIGRSMVAAAQRRLTGAEVRFQVTSFEDLAVADAF